MKILREKIGCWLHERWRTELVLRLPRLAEQLDYKWLDLCNRNERLLREPESQGRICDWQDTSGLTVCRVFPRVGARLLDHCLKQWPIEFTDTGQCRPGETNIQLSIILAVRGRNRLPLFNKCLSSLLAQKGCNYEIIVVEQSWENIIEEALPEGVRYLHARSVSAEMPFNKSWAMNVGAQHAKGQHLVFHDADMLAPRSYAKQVCDILDSGYDAVRLPRFVAYLDRETSERICGGDSLNTISSLSEIVQNCRGVSLAISSDAYWRIGGHDEAFYGWGGEDDEMLSRVMTLRVYPGAFLPFIHLWHPNESGKVAGKDRGNTDLFKTKMSQPVEKRIEILRRLELGKLSSPSSAPT